MPFTIVGGPLDIVIVIIAVVLILKLAKEALVLAIKVGVLAAIVYYLYNYTNLFQYVWSFIEGL
ncbi:hypothetical protein [Dethiothermospora halolimnae]|uniref:hypothetical protein n=1 Tax=Dethiothermospora halolimnae TaxID=3114390 RepID=UPI003CCBA4DD